MSTPAAFEHPARPATSPGATALSVARPRADALLTTGLAAIICAVAFGAQGGLLIGRATPAEMALVLGGGLAVAAAALVAARRERLWGSVPLLALVALAVLTALSIGWAAQPADAWLEANRTLAYVAVFAAAVAAAHAAPGRWSAVLGAITLAAVVVSGYAVLTKILPGALNPDETFARLREPFGYWNSVGLMAALGVPGCLWLGARRSGHQGLNALACPALGLLVLTMLLAYSRGALLAAALGCAFWFGTVPLRLRGAAVLLSGLAGGGLVAAWAFSQNALTEDRVPIDLRNGAGLQLGLALLVVLAVLLLAGLAVNFVAATHVRPEWLRRRAGIALLVGVALVPVVYLGSFVVSDQGLGGSISSRWESLTDPNARIPVNDPSRLTAAGSVRARYWDEALRIFEDNAAGGVGAGGYATVRKRYRTADPAVRHAHGYVVQTLADLGLAGLAVSLALLAAWLMSAARATGLRRDDRRLEFTPERIGLLTLVAIVVIFGVHSLIDWTWFVPANAGVALLAAGWVAGRGPLRERVAVAAGGAALGPRLRAGLRERERAVVAGAALLLAVVCAWTVWQPLRSESAGQDSIATLDSGDIAGARAQAQSARDRNPLSVDPLFELSTIETRAGRKFEAQRALKDAVALQPENPDTWLRLAQFELDVNERPRAALTAIAPALYLDPRSSDAVAVFLQAQRQTAAT
ncbi:MAG TPA: O-antigen ligase family protein [Solirubrobacteraceae bacterium]|nr:O-antigen ligase family protein [Solirubrobacteraceae bacterium]